VLEGQLDVVVALLAAGAEPDALNSAGAAPLHLAAQKGQGKVVAALLAQGADPNVRNAKGWGPVLVSVLLCLREAYRETGVLSCETGRQEGVV
jgi:ankyrin repeat protein